MIYGFKRKKHLNIGYIVICIIIDIFYIYNKKRKNVSISVFMIYCCLFHYRIWFFDGASCLFMRTFMEKGM